MNTNRQIKYLTFGSPLMDMIVDVDNDFINKFGLQLDTTIHVESKSNNVFNEARTFKPKYIAGGCSYNTIRMLNWMLNADPLSVACLGSVGNDGDGEMYKELLEVENIVPIFEKIPEKETGKCAVICLKRERTHLTDLGASTSISEDFINKNWERISDVNLIFTELYILSSKKNIVMKLAEHCLTENKLFGFNLPASFFLNKFSEDILQVISYGDVIFSNKEEAKFFVSSVLNKNYYEESELAEILAKLPKVNKNKKRVFVVTCGPDPAHVCVYDHSKNEIVFKGSFEPCLVSKEKVIDTNGAGDAFAGGFLAYYIQGFDFESCMGAGHYAASNIIQRRGFDVPYFEKPNVSFNTVERSESDIIEIEKRLLNNS